MIKSNNKSLFIKKKKKNQHKKEGKSKLFLQSNGFRDQEAFYSSYLCQTTLTLMASQKHGPSYPNDNISYCGCDLCQPVSQESCCPTRSSSAVCAEISFVSSHLKTAGNLSHRSGYKRSSGLGKCVS